jgi:hypothetical protein
MNLVRKCSSLLLLAFLGAYGGLALALSIVRFAVSSPDAAGGPLRQYGSTDVSTNEMGLARWT